MSKKLKSLDNLTCKCEVCGETHCVISKEEGSKVYHYDCPNCGKHGMMTDIKPVSSNKEETPYNRKSLSDFSIYPSIASIPPITSISSPASVDKKWVKEVVEEVLKEKGFIF